MRPFSARRLLYRQDHDYREAIKCYLNALRIDKENLQILRDLAMLQVLTERSGVAKSTHFLISLTYVPHTLHSLGFLTLLHYRLLPGHSTLSVRCAQIQTRDLPGFVETRNTLLVLKPSNRAHWICFALALHANKSHDVAVQVRQGHARRAAPSVTGSMRLTLPLCVHALSAVLGRPPGCPLGHPRTCCCSSASHWGLGWWA